MAAPRIGAMIRRDVPPADVAQHGLALQADFDELWVVEDLPYAGGISQATATLAATSEVVVGHGIAPAPFRNPAALAMEWATLAAMYPGRVLTGVGHGVQSWMHQIGAGVESPLTLLGETIEAVRRLLHGENVSMDGRYVRLDDVALEFPPAEPPPVFAGVVGPKSLRLSGQVADGTILPEGHGPTEIAAALAHIEQGRSQRASGAHQPSASHQLTVFATFHVGDDSDLAEPNPEVSTAWSATGPDPDQVTQQLQSLFDAGAHSVVLVPLAKDPLQQLQLAAAEVVPRLTLP